MEDFRGGEVHGRSRGGDGVRDGEVEALSLAVVCCSSHFPVEGKVETVKKSK